MKNQPDLGCVGEVVCVKFCKLSHGHGRWLISDQEQPPFV